MDCGLSDVVGDVESCLAPCSASTSTTPQRGKSAVVGVLDRSWRAGCAWTSTAGTQEQAEVGRSGVADVVLATSFASTPFHLGPSASAPMLLTATSRRRVAGVVKVLLVAIFERPTPATPGKAWKVLEWELEVPGASRDGGCAWNLGRTTVAEMEGSSGHGHLARRRHQGGRQQ